MEKQKFVVLIGLPKYVNWFNAPKIGEYDNPQVKKVTPCVLRDGSYFSWETGEKVVPTENTLVWNLSVGTMFRLKNEKEVLISRNFKGEPFLTNGVAFNPKSMVRYEAK